jgi:hypothetical protein
LLQETTGRLAVHGDLTVHLSLPRCSQTFHLASSEAEVGAAIKAGIDIAGEISRQILDHTDFHRCSFPLLSLGPVDRLFYVPVLF